MPVEEKKTVDIDTSGPGAEVEVPEEKVIATEPEIEVKDEETIKDDSKPDDTAAEPDERVDVRDSKDDKEPSETKQDEKLAEYSDSVKRRIAKLTKNWREAERQKDEAIHYAQSVEQKRKAWESKYAKLDSTYLKDSETRIKSQLDAVKGKLAAAIESGDTAKQVEAQTELSALTGDARSIESEKIRRESYEPRTPATEPGLPAQTPTLPQVDEKAEDWATQNTWFGKDRAMTFTAFEHHKDLVEKEGFDPKSNDYYAEIDKRIRVDFPHKFGKGGSTETAKPVIQTVASVRRSVKPGRTQVKLTSSQVAIAKKLGVPLEEYAKQLINVKEA